MISVQATTGSDIHRYAKISRYHGLQLRRKDSAGMAAAVGAGATTTTDFASHGIMLLRYVTLHYFTQPSAIVAVYTYN